jgi:serine/threonine protein phosphatase PrpC
VGILHEALPQARDTELMRGDAVVMMTDGLCDALGQELFAALLEQVGGANTVQDAAEALLHAGLNRGRADDMTVIVARVS